jgi:hypothetical protein
MKILKKIFNQKKYRNEKATIDALTTFINQFYFGQILPPTEAQKNLEDGTLELTWKSGAHCGNGLLVTDDGLFVTCAHCLGNNLEKQRARNHTGNCYGIEKVLTVSSFRKNDIVLAKAAIPGERKARSYKFGESENPPEGKPVALFGRKGNEVYRKYGFVKGTYMRETIMTDNGETRVTGHVGYKLTSERGDSGGIIADIERKIVGIVSLGSELDAQGNPREGFTSGVKWFKVLEMIAHYKVHLERKWA